MKNLVKTLLIIALASTPCFGKTFGSSSGSSKSYSSPSKSYSSPSKSYSAPSPSKSYSTPSYSKPAPVAPVVSKPTPVRVEPLKVEQPKRTFGAGTAVVGATGAVTGYYASKQLQQDIAENKVNQKPKEVTPSVTTSKPVVTTNKPTEVVRPVESRKAPSQYAYATQESRTYRNNHTEVYYVERARDTGMHWLPMAIMLNSANNQNHSGYNQGQAQAGVQAKQIVCYDNYKQECVNSKFDFKW